MKKIRPENYVNLTEDRLSKKKKKNLQIQSILVLFGCMLVLVLVMYIAGILYGWIDDQFQKNADDLAAAASDHVETLDGTAITYTEEEMQTKLNEVMAQTASETRNEILQTMKKELTNGETMVETLRPFYPDELVLVSEGNFHFVPISDELKKNTYQEENLIKLESGEYQYQENGQVITHKGIDVSRHQGTIDWTKVAEDGVEFAFIRVGIRGYGTGKLVEDENFAQNVEGAAAAGIKVGVYFYSQAITREELLEEAQFIMEKIAPYQIDCPIVFDVEKVAGADGRMNQLTLEERTNLTLLFCQTIENAGYTPMIYHNMEMGTLMLDLATLENYEKWFAYYNGDMYYPYAYQIWQYTDKGTVNGIAGKVDLNIWFED